MALRHCQDGSPEGRRECLCLGHAAALDPRNPAECKRPVVAALGIRLRTPELLAICDACRGCEDRWEGCCADTRGCSRLLVEPTAGGTGTGVVVVVVVVVVCTVLSVSS
jgi:hypothetical protein